MTGQTLLNYMEVLNPELQLQSGEADATKGLLALTMAQSYLVATLASTPHVMGDGVGILNTTTNTESTIADSAMLRIDRLQMLDDTASQVLYDMTPIKRTGGHGVMSGNIFDPATAPNGRPTHYWTNGAYFYWYPTPDAVYHIRTYGFNDVAVIDTATTTLTWPTYVALPLATLAVKLMKLGIDDPIQDIAGLAQEVFKPVLDIMANFNRDGAKGLEYTQIHSE